MHTCYPGPNVSRPFIDITSINYTANLTFADPSSIQMYAHPISIFPVCLKAYTRSRTSSTTRRYHNGTQRPHRRRARLRTERCSESNEQGEPLSCHCYRNVRCTLTFPRYDAIRAGGSSAQHRGTRRCGRCYFGLLSGHTFS